jgi:hypothetical protein
LEPGSPAERKAPLWTNHSTPAFRKQEESTMIFHRSQSQITVRPEDCLSETEHSGYTTEYDQSGYEATEAAVIAALAEGHLTADQALWLHVHHINWQINVEGH